MKLLCRILVSLCWSCVVLADTVRTPLRTPGLLGDPSTQPTCVALNIGSNPHDVTVELRDETNAVLATTECPALAVSSTCTLTAPGQSRIFFCRISALAAHFIRGTLMMVDSSGRVTSAVVTRRED